MFRISRFALGGFVTYQRVVPDWRQFFSRDDAHTLAKEKLQSLTETGTSQVISREEAEQLVHVFTISHNADGVSNVIQYMRNTLEMELLPRHYHALFRVFNFDREKENAAELLSVMFDRGATNLETYARIIDGIHTLAPKDALTRILQVVEAVYTMNGSLVWDAPLEDGSSATAKEAPMLTSLLHHVTHDERYPPYLPIIVGLWIRALGVRLSDWDYTNIVNALVAKPAMFSTVRQMLGCLPGPHGHFTLADVMDQLLARGELSRCPAASDVMMVMHKLHSSDESIWRHSTDSGGIANLGTPSLPAMVDMILDAVGKQRGLGPRQYNPFPVFHTTMLLYSTLRNDTEALMMIPKALAASNQWKALYPEESIANVEQASAEGFELHQHLLLDLGYIFSRFSNNALKEIAPSYTLYADAVSSKASDVEAAMCGAYALPMMRTNEEARQAWNHILASIDPDARKVPHTVRLLVKKFVEFCARHPIANCKMTAKGLQEREKWQHYLNARDIALALFGTCKHGRDAMRHFYFHKGVQQALRSEEMIAKDVEDTVSLFGIPPQRREAVLRRKERHSPTPLLPDSSAIVPAHLYDVDVENPFPHCRLRRGVHEKDTITEDFFPEVWTTLMTSRNGLGAQKWYFKDPEMFMALLKCLVHRLDWEAATQLTLQCAPVNFEFTFLMDQELQTMFWEIGDPAGALAFKVATKLYDARIQEGSQSRRDAFQATVGNSKKRSDEFED